MTYTGTENFSPYIVNVRMLLPTILRGTPPADLASGNATDLMSERSFGLILLKAVKLIQLQFALVSKNV